MTVTIDTPMTDTDTSDWIRLSHDKPDWEWCHECAIDDDPETDAGMPQPIVEWHQIPHEMIDPWTDRNVTIYEEYIVLACGHTRDIDSTHTDDE